MNVGIVGKLQSSHNKDGASSFFVKQPNRIGLNCTGPHIVFQKLYEEEESDADLFYGSISPLVNICIAGYNVCLLVMGTKKSQKSSLIGGSRSSPGIITYLFKSLFNSLSKGGTSSSNDCKLESIVQASEEPNVTVQMWELNQETIKDLLAATQFDKIANYRQLVETPISGVYVENCTTIRIKNATEAITKFHLGWTMKKRNQSVWNDSSTFIQIKIHLNAGINSFERNAKFTIVELPLLENLIDCQEFGNFEDYNLKQDKALIVLKDVVTKLAHHPNFGYDVNYQGSKLSLMLKEELGGNCHTCAILSLENTIKAELFQEIQIFIKNLSQVVNFPIINDVQTQALLTRYRAQIIDLKQQLDVFSGQSDLSVSIVGSHPLSQEKLHKENVQLKISKDDLMSQINKLQGRFEVLQLSETDLTCQLLISEEERLKLSELLIDHKIQIKELEKSASSKERQFTDKIIELEKLFRSSEEEKTVLLQNLDITKCKLSSLEEEIKLLMEENSTLKISHRNLKQKFDIEVKKNKELHLEVVNLVNQKSFLEKELNCTEFTKNPQLQVKDNSIKKDNVLALNQIISDLKEKLFHEKEIYKNDIRALKMQLAEQLKNEEKKQSDELQTWKAFTNFNPLYSKYLEEERAQMLSENQVLKTESKEMKQYIDQLLAKKSQEVKKKKSQRKNIFPAIHSSLN